MSEHWPVSNEGVGMPPQPLEKENARLREALKAIDSGVRSGPYRDYGASYEALRAIARAALGDQAKEAEDG